MEHADHELLLQIVPSHPILRKLYNQHKKLEKEVEKFRHYARYSSSAALREQELKKQKLLRKEEIMGILRDHKGAP